VDTRGGDRGIESRDINIPVDRRSGKSILKTPTQIRTVHLEGTRGNNRSHRGKARQEVVYRHFGHRDIGNPGDKRFGHFRIAKSKTPKRRKVPLWGLDVSISENRDSRD
jgi:hypothetical protein